MENPDDPGDRNITDRSVDLTSIDMLPYVLNRLTAGINQRWLATLRPHGLTNQRWQVLSILSALDGSRIGAIVAMSGNEQPVVSRVIDQMQRDGLVKRQRDGKDNRITRIWITPKGRSLYELLLPSAASFVETLVTALDDDERDVLMRLLAKMIRNGDEPSSPTRTTASTG